MPVLHDADILRGLGRGFTLASVTTVVGAISLGVNGLTAVVPGVLHTVAEFDLNLAAAATDAGDTLDVYVDTTLDGGVLWTNIIHFTQILGNGGAKRETMAINPRGNVGTAPLNTAADLAAAGVRHLVGSQYRVRYAQVDADSDAAFTFTVKMHVS